jgi:2-dehydropantoate 2-reductase
MRFLVVGAGATGGFFGARLAQAGRDVTFLVREGRAAHVRANGLAVVDPRGEIATISPNVVTRDGLSGSYDCVLLGVKAYSLERAIEDFAPAVGAGTAILPMLNGMRHIDIMSARFGADRVLGGACIVSTTLDDAGRIVQLNDMQELVYGELGGDVTERAREIERAMSGAGFTATVSHRIVHDMWQKWVTLASLGGINATMRGTIDDVVAVPGGREFALAYLDEAAAVAAAAGYALSPAAYARISMLLTTPGALLTSSMYRDLVGNRPIEADAIVGDMVERARTLGVDAPLVAAAYANLKIYERRRNGDAKV